MLHTVIGKATKALATVAAAALGVGIITGSAAVAADSDNGNISLPAGKGSITIHKYQEQDDIDWSNKPNDGTELTSIPQGAQTIEGVTFTLYKVSDVDLTNQADWTGVSTLNSSSVDNAMNPTNVTIGAKTLDITKVGDYSTNGRGIAKFGNLDLGLYYVVESDTGNNQIVKKAAPFFITIPYAARAGAWNYNPHVYPKNTVNNSGSKTVDVLNVKKIGDPVTWTIKQTLPKSDNGYTAVGAVDPLDPVLKLADANNQPIGFDASPNDLKKAVTVKVNGDTIDSDLYTVTKADIYRQGDRRNAIRIALNKANPDDPTSVITDPTLNEGDEVAIVIRTIVAEMPESGEVPNSAYKIINEYDPFNQPGGPGNLDNPGNPGDNPPPIESEENPRYGDYAFKKIDDTSDKKPLAGAVFEIWNANDEVVAEATSDEHGVVHFKGIFLGKYPKSTAAAVVSKPFKLVEKVAPAGYKLPTASIDITVSQGKITDAANTNNFIENEKSDLPSLPLTGAAGKVILTLAGAGLIALASGTFMVSRRRMQREI